jgi:hypothetical protein
MNKTAVAGKGKTKNQPRLNAIVHGVNLIVHGNGCVISNRKIAAYIGSSIPLIGDIGIEEEPDQ